MKKLLIFMCLTTLSPVQATSFSQKAARAIANGLFYLIASSDASKQTTSHAKNLLNEVDPTKELLAVRKFNRFGKFLFGNHNTITIPYLNYLIVDNEGMENLSEEARRFVLGRCMITLRDKEKYLGYKYALPLIMNQVHERATTPDEKDKAKEALPKIIFEDVIDPYTNKAMLNELTNEKLQIPKELYIPSLQKLKDNSYPLSISTLTLLIKNYFSRGIEYELDIKTARELDCAEGAVDYLAHTEGITLKRLLALLAYDLTPRLTQAALSQPQWLYNSEKKLVRYTLAATKYLPGQNSIVGKWGGGYSYLPLIGNLFNSFPDKERRIDFLKKKCKTTTAKTLEELNELERAIES